MEKTYQDTAKVLKALSDPSRLKILDMLSCGEACACDLLEYFDFSQPTLSHHMKLLQDCGLVSGKKDGIWTKYRLNSEEAYKLVQTLEKISTHKEECICNLRPKHCGCQEA